MLNEEQVCQDIDAVLTARHGRRTFKDIMNEWIESVLQENQRAKNNNEVLMVGRLGILGLRLISEANSVGMWDIADEASK